MESASAWFEVEGTPLGIERATPVPLELREAVRITRTVTRGDPIEALASSGPGVLLLRCGGIDPALGVVDPVVRDAIRWAGTEGDYDVQIGPVRATTWFPVRVVDGKHLDVSGEPIEVGIERLSELSRVSVALIVALARHPEDWPAAAAALDALRVAGAPVEPDDA